MGRQAAAVEGLVAGELSYGEKRPAAHGHIVKLAAGVAERVPELVKLIGFVDRAAQIIGVDLVDRELKRQIAAIRPVKRQEVID